MNQYKPEGMLISSIENRDYLSSRAGIEKALERQVILEAPAVLCDRNFSLHVDLGSMHGIMPREEVQYSKYGDDIKDIAILTRVGRPVCFKISGFTRDENGETVAVLSRRAAQTECMLNYTDTLVPGDIIPSRITHLENFGAFVDIGCGIVSLLSIDCISVSRISHPRARLSSGDTLYTVIKNIDENGRIYVSERELLGTWEENAALFTEGQTVVGIVRSIESYGIFVELSPNLAGLAELKDDVKVGQTAAVYIKSIIPEKMKIKLIIIDSHDSSQKPSPLTYFIDTDKVFHIDRWVYSPASSEKCVETVF